MSPRRIDPKLATTLLEAAARLLAEEGAAGLTTRRLAAAVGTSTTAVYTHFGGMDNLVRAMVHEGFARLHRRMSIVRATPDAVADVMALGYAYRANSLDHPQLYQVMFGSAALGGFALAEGDRQHGKYTLQPLVDAVARATEQGRFRTGDPLLVAQNMWIALHGLVSLELGGYLIDPYDADVCFEAQLRSLMVGAGDGYEATAASLARARRRRSPRT
ncbi:putative HTH-type transcriptional regulator [Micromonospora sp. MW-13]|uniref:TetR-like C-terminal domain-containing protein n=1 Tax=unclassified Micromonospora TaxID=2617518 RepID=UPI000E43923C|nr:MULTISPECIES: TetR-like C-terminal domain-containing protein [unclassified Micromonospora]MCX4472220.1 TetR/AcrR family transcriptional regulator [Micromonospora sp. NBC_01655]RGC65438.1 putative HTH-type transcriptional regulator [Micromonospora sp. MW-13]